MPMIKFTSRSRSRPKSPIPPCTTSCGKKPCSGCPWSKSTEFSNKLTLSRSKSRSRSRGREPCEPVQPSWKKDSPSKTKMITEEKNCKQPEQSSRPCVKLPTPAVKIVKPSKCDGDTSKKQSKIDEAKSSSKLSCKRPGCTPKKRCISCCKGY